MMPFTTYSRSKITSIKGSYGCPRWFDAVYNSDVDYIKKHFKNINKVRIANMVLKQNGELLKIISGSPI
jgi:hypothetical protein